METENSHHVSASNRRLLKREPFGNRRKVNRRPTALRPNCGRVGPLSLTQKADVLFQVKVFDFECKRVAKR
jgi:hypothetical protein